ncbi:hypothetical protein VTK26DRAFT_729 [Humicola hyalothermophila]
MKPVTYAALFLGLLSAALAQGETLEPSPTESVGCEPHGDHWHCEGPRVTSAATDVVTTSSAVHDHEDDHEDDHDDEHSDAAGTGSLPPSPTASYGCEPHGDHWHCEGAVTATTATGPEETADAATTTTATGAAPTLYQGAGLGVAGLVAGIVMAM